MESSRFNFVLKVLNERTLKGSVTWHATVDLDVFSGVVAGYVIKISENSVRLYTSSAELIANFEDIDFVLLAKLHEAVRRKVHRVDEALDQIIVELGA